MKTFKILSYNIHKGFSVGNRRFVLDQIKNSIRSTHSDLVCLQEVMGNNKHLINASQFEFLADSVWHHFSYGKNAVKSKGDHGNAILSKFPIVKWKNIDISSSILERRGILYSKIKMSSDNYLHVFCLHLSLLEKDRKKQVKNLFKSISKLTNKNDSIIVSGDFNDWMVNLNEPFEIHGFSEAFSTLFNENAKSFPSYFPMLKLDRIYFKNLQVVSAFCLTGKPWNDLSDHVAISAEFKLK